MECARLFYRQEMYIQHLRKNHDIDGDAAKSHLRKNQIGRNAQYQFWCGFCRKIIPSRNRGLDSWNERFSHIDIEHFKKGERIEDWLPAEGNLTNNERDQAQKKRAAEMATGASEVISDDSNGNTGSSTGASKNNNNSDISTNTSDTVSRAASAEDEDSPGDTGLPIPGDDNAGDSDVECVMEIVGVRSCTDPSRPPATPGPRKRKFHTSDRPECAAMTDTDVLFSCADQNEQSSRDFSPSSRASSPKLTDSMTASRLFSIRTEESVQSTNSFYCVSLVLLLPSIMPSLSFSLSLCHLRIKAAF